VHGLWPQYENGFPSYCQVPAPRLDRTDIGRALDMMPSPALVMHEWGPARHPQRAFRRRLFRSRALGACGGENSCRVSRTRRACKRDAGRNRFVKVNPGLGRADMAVARKARLSEVRPCLGKDFSFHACPNIARHAYAREKMEMPAVGSEHAAATP
jgi:ribonuclease T2